MDTKREDRLCQVCHSSEDVEDEQHFLFSCPADSDVRQKYASIFQQAFSVSVFFTNSEPNVRGGILRECCSRQKYIVKVQVLRNLSTLSSLNAAVIAQTLESLSARREICANTLLTVSDF